MDWGRLDIEGLQGPVKDAKLWPGGARAWDWTETGTHHHPGVQVGDVEEIVHHGAKTVVLATGQWHRLNIADATVKWLEDQGVTVHRLPTKDAVAKYNELREHEPVGALIHSTC